MRKHPIVLPLKHVTPILKRTGLNRKLEPVEEMKKRGKNIDKSGYME